MNVTPATDVARVRDAHTGVLNARAAVTAAEAELQHAVRDALLAGVSAVEIAEVLGVTRARVYQLRDGRR